jgi:hypothetical protein
LRGLSFPPKRMGPVKCTAMMFPPVVASVGFRRQEKRWGEKNLPPLRY